MNEKRIIKFNPEYLKATRGATTTQIADFLECYRLLQGENSVEAPISLHISPELLNAFKAKCALFNRDEQTQIKKLMRQFVEGNDV